MRKLFGKALIFAFVVCLSLVLVSCGDEPTVQISEDGYWVINGEKTDVKAAGEKGEKGDKGDTGANGSDAAAKEENPQGLDFCLKDDGTYSVGIGNAIYLSEITIPSTYNGRAVTEIGVFCPEDVGESTRLKKINIPDSIITIGESAFDECWKLTSVTIPDSVTTIGERAFYYCGLTSIVIPDSVTTIGEAAFSYCDSLTSITVSENNTAYKDINGNLYTKDGKTLIQYAMGKTDTSFTIPDSVTTIGKAAFSGCESLTSVVIGDSVTTIGEWAFSYCGLTSVVIGDSVTTIGEYAFYYCDSLTSVVIGDSVTTIGGYAFSGCESLTDVYYTGSEEEWADIIIELENDYWLNKATIHFNYIGE